MHKYIAIDLGAESGRVIVATLGDGRVDLEEIHRFGNGPVQVNQGLYWDVLHLWREIKLGLTKAASLYGTALRSLAVDTWGIDYALLDRHDQLLANPRCYRDPSTAGVMERVFGQIPKWEIYQQSGGIQFLSINTLYQLAARAEQQDAALSRAATFLMMPDLFHFWLSGRKACEFTDATSTQFYAAAGGGWARGLLGRLQIPDNIFPEVVLPGTVLGQLQSLLVEETGLPPLPVVAPAAHDTASAIVAVPAASDQFAWLSSGTWSLLGGIAAAPIVTPAALDCNFSSYGGPEGLYLPWKNIMGLWLVQECRRIWAREGKIWSYDDLTAMAASALPFVALIDPDAPAFLAPADMTKAIADFCTAHGEAVPGDAGAMVRCVLESLALRYRWTFEKLGELQGRTFDALYIVGGGARNELLCQFTANACGVPVIAGPVEATAIGNAALQAVALGDLASLQEARDLVRTSATVKTFEPHQQAVWTDAFARFQALMV